MCRHLRSELRAAAQGLEEHKNQRGSDFEGLQLGIRNTTYIRMLFVKYGVHDTSMVYYIFVFYGMA